MIRRTAALLAATVLAWLTAGAPPAYADGIRDAQWHLRFLDVPGAHRLSQGAGVTVAVVDSGVDAAHPDLADNLLPAVAADRRTDGPATSDVDGRGTGLAGLIAGHGHGAGRAGAGTVGADGVLGLAPRVRILPVAFTTRPGQFGDPDVLADAIDVAVVRGATVICVGRGLPASPRLEQAVAEAVRADVVVVAPVANRRDDGFLPWPAAYPGVVAVAPLDRSGAPAVPQPPESAPRPALAAPGVDLLTTDTGGGYRIDAGTGSAALVAGAAALVRARYPGLRADEVVRRLTATARAATPRAGSAAPALDLVGALTAAVPPSADPAPSPTRTAPAAVPGAAATASVSPAPAPVARAAFDTGDWRRWLVALPLIGFLAGLAAYAARGSRRHAAR